MPHVRTIRRDRSIRLALAAVAMLSLPALTPAASAADRGAQRLATADQSATAAPVAAGRVSGEGFGAFLAARQARADGDTAAAARYYNAALKADPDNAWLLRRAFLLSVSEGLLSDALPLAGRVLDNDETAPVANLTIAVDDLKNGRYGKAESRIAAAGKRGSMRLVGPMLRAWAAFGAGAGREAVDRLDQLDKTEAFSVFSDYSRGLILAAAGDLDGAILAFEALPPGTRFDLRSSLVKVAVIEQRDGPEAARAELELLRRRFGDDPLLAGYLDGSRAVADAFPVRDANDGAAEALYGAASAMARDSINDISMIYLRMALHLRPDMDVAQALLGDIREANDRWAEAIAAYEGIAAGSPYKWGARLRIAWALHRLDRTGPALELLRRMAEERPGDTSALTTLADILRGQSRFAEAAEVYGEAIGRLKAHDAGHWALFYARGIARERSGDWASAETDLLKALELQPRQPLVMNYLGYSWADKGERLDEAIDMIRAAVDQRPTDGYIVDSLGWALFRMGRHEEAVQHLERAVELRPDDPTINDHLGDVYWFVGRRLESCYQWKRALTLDPDTGQVEELREKLQGGLADTSARFRGCG